jgi:hypothetical protein
MDTMTSTGADPPAHLSRPVGLGRKETRRPAWLREELADLGENLGDQLAEFIQN